MRIALLETAPRDEPGSMRRYAELLTDAFTLLCAQQGESNVQVDRVCVAPSAARLQRWPRRLRSWGHHTAIAANVLALKHRDYDLFHVLDGSHAYVTRFLPARRTLVTAHDIIPLLQSQGKFPVAAPGRGAQWIIRSSVRGLSRAARVLVDSEATRRDLIQAGLPEQRLELCYLANTMPPLGKDHGLDITPAVGTAISRQPYVFHVGNNGFYKNRAGVVRIFAELRRTCDVRLIMAGPPPAPSLTTLVQELRVESSVTFLVDPTDDDLKALYSNAALLLFPSHYEGFGWPPLEAMSCGCPVVASDRGSLPEVVGDAGLIGDPENIALLAEHCRTVLTNPNVSRRLIAAGHANVQRFTLESMGAQVLQAYRNVQDAAQRDNALAGAPG